MGKNYKVKIIRNEFRNGKIIEIGKDDLKFSDQELIEHIVTCGLPMSKVNVNFLEKHRLEMAYKCYLVKMALQVDQNGYIMVSDNIKHLDPSEKSFVSYYIGMFITKIISKKKFGFEYLVHLNTVKKNAAVISGKREPDLVGYNLNDKNYALFEVKGRQTNYISKSVINSANKQLQSVISIDGEQPGEKIICITYPVKENNELKCVITLQNKWKLSGKASTEKLKKDQLLYSYYLPVYKLIKEQKSNNVENECEFELEDNIESKDKETEANGRCKIKMAKKLYDIFDKQADSESIELIQRLENELKDDKDILTVQYIGSEQFLDTYKKTV